MTHSTLVGLMLLFLVVVGVLLVFFPSSPGNTKGLRDYCPNLIKFVENTYPITDFLLDKPSKMIIESEDQFKDVKRVIQLSLNKDKTAIDIKCIMKMCDRWPQRKSGECNHKMSVIGNSAPGEKEAIEKIKKWMNFAPKSDYAPMSWREI